MPITFACVCGTEIEALDGQVGRKVMCPSCRSDLTVPRRPAPAGPEPVPELGIVVPAPVRLAPGLRRPRPASSWAPRRDVPPWLSWIAGVVATAMLAAFLNWEPPKPRADHAARPGRRVALDPAAVPTPEPDRAPAPPRRTRVSTGDPGGPIWLERRAGLEVDPDVPDPDPGRPVEVGGLVSLAGPGDDPDDVIVFGDLAGLRTAHSPNFPGKADRLRSAARLGRAFAVPRGAVAVVLEVRDAGIDLLPGTKAVRLRLRPTDEAAWVAEAYVR